MDRPGNQASEVTILIYEIVHTFLGGRFQARSDAPLRAMATILIVDDDPLQASFIMSLLGRQFGNVCRVNDAAEALCLIEQPEFASKLRLVISGHHTPGIGGPAFVAELHSRKPELPVLVLGANGAAPSDYTEAHVVFLSRPVGRDKMLAVTGQILADRKHAVA